MSMSKDLALDVNSPTPKTSKSIIGLASSKGPVQVGGSGSESSSSLPKAAPQVNESFCISSSFYF